MVVVGLTGSIGTGKSTVSRMLSDLGAKVISSDKIVHEEMRKGGVLFKPILGEFGVEILGDKEIDRRKLSTIVFKSKAKLQKLERLVHPVVRQVITDKLKVYSRKAKRHIVVVEVPLLFESGFNNFCDVTVVVKVNQKKQIARARHRLSLTRQEVLKRIKIQIPQKEKIKLADIVIDNSGTLLETRKQVKKLWQKLSQRVKK